MKTYWEPFYVILSAIVLCVLQIESRNNKLGMQSVNNKALIEELDKLLERLRIPSEVSLPYIFHGNQVIFINSCSVI